MKKLALILFLFIMVSSIYSLDFRRNNFGDSIQKIKQEEISTGDYSEVVEESYTRLIYYNVPIAEKYIANLVYHFEKNVFVYAYYVVHSVLIDSEPKTFDRGVYWMNAYNDLCSKLNELYGPSLNLFTEIEQNQLKKVISGDEIVQDSWHLNNKNIRVFLDPSIEGVISSVKIHYSDVNYSLPPLTIENGGL
ncbi:MAG: hypothetical protein JEZ04_10085 [Spirochaetales bacterium]|nr:hypothetical protein [Spirochaetales bacterium]